LEARSAISRHMTLGQWLRHMLGRQTRGLHITGCTGNASFTLVSDSSLHQQWKFGDSSQYYQLGMSTHSKNAHATGWRSPPHKLSDWASLYLISLPLPRSAQPSHHRKAGSTSCPAEGPLPPGGVGQDHVHHHFVWRNAKSFYCFSPWKKPGLHFQYIPKSILHDITTNESRMSLYSTTCPY